MTNLISFNSTYTYLEEVDGVVKMVTTVDFTHVALKLKAFKNTG